jgi:hypothetical protein
MNGRRSSCCAQVATAEKNCSGVVERKEEGGREAGGRALYSPPDQLDQRRLA